MPQLSERQSPKKVLENLTGQGDVPEDPYPDKK